MRKPLHIWITFICCLGLLLAAMGWVSWNTLALEKERETAAREAEQQERVRLALWRLDFQASALMIRENARPSYDFRPFHSPEGLVNKAYDNVAKGEVLVPSPLLAEVPEHVLLHFQMDSRGQVLSPQVPQNDERTLALAQFINAEDLTRSEQRLSGLRELLAKPAQGIAPPKERESRLLRSSSAPSSLPAPAPVPAPASVSAGSPPLPSAPGPVRTPAPAPSVVLNRQVLAEMACVVRFDIDDSKPTEMNDAKMPRNYAWNSQQGQVTTQQVQLNNSENISRNRAVTLQAEEAIKQQPMIKLKTGSGTLVLNDAKEGEAKTSPAKALKKEAEKPAESSKPATRPAMPALASKAVNDKAEKDQKPMPPATLAPMPKPDAAPAPAPPGTPATPAVPKAAASLAANAAPPAAAAKSALPASITLSGGAPAPTDPSSMNSLSLAAQPAVAFQRSTNSSRPFQGVWLGGNLMLTREAYVDGVRMVQGVWLDWPALRAALLREITDLFPDAKLEPAANATAGTRPEDDLLRFAALPVRLVPGAIQLPPLPFWTPLRRSLGIALACVLLAAVAVGLVLFGTVALSERRADFVSAVTHELRTPLTTFRLYSEMLADGMVADEAQRKTYLDTLTGEAGRLSHLVENVLAYARLERGSAKARAENVTIGELLDRILPRLQQRASDCGMEVRVQASETDRKTQLHVDAAAVEQILFNLVDNACKYAAPRAAEPVIHVEADTSGKFAMLRVRDHGGGISRSERRRIFHPFHKSADQAAHSAPGVGLGLALCRRLATALGGEISLDATHKQGACFMLRLPK
ncbi:sensor histidine kinase [Prosthecobacter sp.]|uniref:sensor histidine kinase n=1 Tax=Prosthecobacter sp. TaxID=1965333 RepID=UPI0037851B5B